MWSSRGWGLQQPESSSYWKEGARGALRGGRGGGGEEQRASAGTLGPESRGVRAPGKLWEVQDPSSSLSLAFLPPLSPPLPLLLLPPPSLDGAAGCRREGPDEDGEAPCQRRGCAEGRCRAARRRAPGRGCGPRAAGDTAGPQPAASRQLSCNDGAQTVTWRGPHGGNSSPSLLTPLPQLHSFIARHSPHQQPTCEGAILTQTLHSEPCQLTPHGAETSPLLRALPRL
ncbi:uncharacterized protein AAES06_022351 [Glossophaga mutica]